MSVGGGSGGGNNSTDSKTKWSTPTIDYSTTAVDVLTVIVSLLTAVVPFMNTQDRVLTTSTTKSVSEDLLVQFCDAIPKLHSISNGSPAELSSKWMDGLWVIVNASFPARTTTVNNEQEGEDKEIDHQAHHAVRVTSSVVFLMQLYPTTHYSGCHILQRTCPVLTRDQRKKLGVVAAVGTVLTSSGSAGGDTGPSSTVSILGKHNQESIIKSICDEILADI